MNKLDNVLVVIITILLWIVLAIISYLATCGLFYLACFGLGWTFSYKVAFGIWILMIMLKGCFPKGDNR